MPFHLASNLDKQFSKQYKGGGNIDHPYGVFPVTEKACREEICGRPSQKELMKIQYPQIPEFIPNDKHPFWRQCWRELYRYWRWQASEDRRYWLACAHTVGFELTEKRLGSEEYFSLIRHIK